MMDRRLVVLSPAEDDLAAALIHLALEASDEVADRFSHSFFSTAQSLLEFPDRGAIHEELRPGLRLLRRVPLAGFGNWMIFYRVTPESVEVVRVLDARRDLARETFD